MAPLRIIGIRVRLLLSIIWLIVSVQLAVKYDNFYDDDPILPDGTTEPLDWSYTRAESRLKGESDVALMWWLSAVGACAVAGVSTIILVMRAIGRVWMIETLASLLVVGAALSFCRFVSLSLPRLGRGPPEAQTRERYGVLAEQRPWEFGSFGTVAMVIVITVMHSNGCFGTRSATSEQRGFDVILK